MSESLQLNGELITPHNLELWRSQQCEPHLLELADFLAQWWAPSEYMSLQSSGSTGNPKIFKAQKKYMRASAEASCRALELKAHSSVLLALPMSYIAARMMIVRALVARLHVQLIAPCARPLTEIERVDFAPLVPYQAAESSAEELERARCLLLGGAAIPPATEQKLRMHSGRVFASYGMTESFSHIALRRVNGEQASAWLSPLPQVQLSANAQGCLTITAPYLGLNELQSTDRVEFNAQGQLRILGRADNVINSGGLKIQAERIEECLSEATGLCLVLVGLPHLQWGECACLMWEGKAAHEAALHQAIEQLLTRQQRPKFIYRVEQLPRGATGKILRAECRTLLLALQNC